jgi:HK97 family phage major capsid protein
MVIKNLDQFKQLLKAVTIGDTPFSGSSSGAVAQPFLPDDLAKAFIDVVTENNNFRKIFRSMYMKNRLRSVPKLLTGTEVYYQPDEATEGDTTSFTASNISLEAKKLFAWIEISEETFEDGISDMASMIRLLFARGMGSSEEKAFLTGDVSHTPVTAVKANATTNTWYNKDARLAFDGILTIAENSGVVFPVNGAATVDVFCEAMYHLGLYAKQASELISFVNPWSANQLLRDENLKTVDKYGANATLLTGEVGRIWNKWVLINSDYIPLGKSVTTIRDNVIIGDRRKIKFKKDEIIKNDSQIWAISERVAMEVEYDDACLVMTGLAEPSVS